MDTNATSRRFATRQRAGLVDEKGFKAFCREVVMLCKLRHPNIVSLVGYSKNPFLLIVMDFINGGDLASFVDAQDPTDPPKMEIVMKILVGTAKGMSESLATEARYNPHLQENATH